jgi:hypothetical protein
MNWGIFKPDTICLLKQIGSGGSTVDTVRLTSEFYRRRTELKPGTDPEMAWSALSGDGRG